MQWHKSAIDVDNGRVWANLIVDKKIEPEYQK